MPLKTIQQSLVVLWVDTALPSISGKLGCGVGVCAGISPVTLPWGLNEEPPLNGLVACDPTLLKAVVPSFPHHEYIVFYNKL